MLESDGPARDGGGTDIIRSGRSCPGRRRRGCEAVRADTGSPSNPSSPAPAEAVLEEPLKGLLGLPDVAHLEAPVREGRDVEHCAAAGSASSSSLAMTASYCSEVTPDQCMNIATAIPSSFPVAQGFAHSVLVRGRTQRSNLERLDYTSSEHSARA